jgi:hypothetical protein
MTTERIWGNLPAEIVQNIFKSLKDISSQKVNYLEYQLVNKWWFFASLSVVYKEINIKYELLNNEENIESLCSLLKYNKYNIGLYVKSIHIQPENNILPIL